MKIPLLDLQAQFKSIEDEIREAIDRVLARQNFINSVETQNFEKNFAAAHETAFGIGCSNGTAAISMALTALGIGAGDEVILPAMTFIASASAIIHVGAKPVLVDIDSDTYTIDPEKVRMRINARTRAILPVHLYGNPCNMTALKELAEGAQIAIIEDAAQAHLAKYKGRPVGSDSTCATFSFYPGKNLGAFGDAGAVITQNNELADRLKAARDHGRQPGSKYSHATIGRNDRMDEIQAAVLDVKLKHLSEWTVSRRRNARIYDQKLKAAGFAVLQEQPLGECVYHQYVVEVKNRDATLAHLKKSGIDAGIHYPIPVHMQPAMQFLGYSVEDFPISERVGAHILSLPVYPEMTAEMIDEVLHRFFEIAEPLENFESERVSEVAV